MISKNQLKYVRQLELKKYRRQEGVFVAEGPKVVGDLLAAGFCPRNLFATQEWIMNSGDGIGNKSVLTPVTDDELRKLSFLQHPQQVIAVMVTPPPAPTDEVVHGLVLALDGVQDPGNLGTIIRIADWFGIETIFCSEDTADAWSPKVVQATMGSIARVHVIYTSLADLLDRTQLPVYGTLLDGDDIYNQELTEEGIIVMGNEGNGISANIRQRINRRLLIPDFHPGGTADSLNVAIATAITCSEFKRRTTK